MEHPTPRAVPGYRWITLFAGLVLILLYAGLCVVLGLSGMVPWFTIPLSMAKTPAPVPTVTSTPHILAHAPATNSGVRIEDFASGLGEWHLYYLTGKMQAVDGQMVVEANTPAQGALVANQGFISPALTYYVQADFTTDVPTKRDYGLIFGANDALGTAYLLDIWPQKRQCSLLRLRQGAWTQMGDGAEAQRRPLPQTNTLSAFFENGTIELYINGNLALTYIDKEPLRSAGVGAFATDPEYRLIVDNFFGYIVK